MNSVGKLLLNVTWYRCLLLLWKSNFLLLEVTNLCNKKVNENRETNPLCDIFIRTAAVTIHNDTIIKTAVFCRRNPKKKTKDLLLCVPNKWRLNTNRHNYDWTYQN